MITPNEAVEVMRKTHFEAIAEAKSHYVPFFLSKLDARIRMTAGNGMGSCLFKLDWSRFGAAHQPSNLVKAHTEHLFSKEIERLGYWLVDKGHNTWEFWWYSEDMGEEMRLKSAQEESDSDEIAE